MKNRICSLSDRRRQSLQAKSAIAVFICPSDHACVHAMARQTYETEASRILACTINGAGRVLAMARFEEVMR